MHRLILDACELGEDLDDIAVLAAGIAEIIWLVLRLKCL
jgi:hypothetical protein